MSHGNVQACLRSMFKLAEGMEGFFTSIVWQKRRVVAAKLLSDVLGSFEWRLDQSRPCPLFE